MALPQLCVQLCDPNVSVAKVACEKLLVEKKVGEKKQRTKTFLLSYMVFFTEDFLRFGYFHEVLIFFTTWFFRYFVIICMMGFCRNFIFGKAQSWSFDKL